MRIRGSRLIAYSLPLKATWRSAAAEFSSRSGWLLRLETDDGRFGWGDCARHQGEACALESRCHELHGLNLDEACAWPGPAGLPLAAACALDTALADLAAQDRGVPLSCLLNPGAESAVKCNAALGVLAEDASLRAGAAVAAGFSMLKLKVGVAGVNQELQWLRQVVDRLPPGVLLRLDANRAWNGEDALRFIEGLEDLPVEMLEEPLADPDPVRLAALQERTPVALALDESLRELNPEQLFAAAPVRRLVIKPALAGGVRAGLEVARRARAAGMMCVVTTSVDNAVGTLASLHLAAALANGLHHGLATSDWLEQDVGNVPHPERGMLFPGKIPGLGFVPRREMAA